MGLFDRIDRLVRANLDYAVSQAEDPEKILDQAVIDMQEDLVQLRQAVASAISTQKRSQQQYNQNQSQANQWQSRAQLALQKGDENLAREALQRKKGYIDTANTIKATLDQQTRKVETLKKNLIALESKISEAKTKKNMLKARAQAAKANEQLQGMISGINPNGATAAFERMEEKLTREEARSQAAGELVGSDLESQFAALEAGSDVDDELAAMKAQLSSAAPNQAQLPQGTQSIDTLKSEVDEELAAMKAQLVQIEEILEQQTSIVQTLKKNLISLESKISEAKTDKNILKVPSQMADELPQESQTNDTPKSEVDDELNELRRQLDKI